MDEIEDILSRANRKREFDPLVSEFPLRKRLPLQLGHWRSSMQNTFYQLSRTAQQKSERSKLKLLTLQG
jgi:hypothetical protein